MKKMLMVIGVFIAQLFLAGSDPSIKDLTQTDLFHLQQKKIVAKTKEIKGSQWPEVTTYALIDATPSECAAAFSYYPDQVHFSHNLTSAAPIKEITSTDVHVSFKMDMPFPFSSSVTVTGNKLTRLNGDHYQVRWYFIQSNYSKNNHGKATFKPFETKTLYIHQNSIVPKSSLAGMFKKNMIRNTRSSARAFVSFAEGLKKKQPDKMKRYIRLMERVLGGEKIYTSFISAPSKKQ